MPFPIINNLKMNTSLLTILRKLTICDSTLVKWNFPNDQRFLGLKKRKGSMLTFFYKEILYVIRENRIDSLILSINI